MPTPTSLGQTPTLPEPAPSPTLPPSQLTVCLGNEPASLFTYTSNGRAAQAVLAAIYDGPFEPDMNLNNVVPIIVEQYPSLENGGMRLDPVTVSKGESIVDSRGALSTLVEGVMYRPAGCTQASCELVYAGEEAVQMNQWVLDYTLLPGLSWSDGVPLTSDDSMYGYEVAQALFPAVQAELLNRTASYTAIDERSVEWKGLPGYQNGDAAEKFFAPLPRHAWGSIAMQDLPASETASRSPIGWGAFVLTEWLPGEHIVLERNPNYFQADAGKPYYDRIVFRFQSGTGQSAVELMASGCDVIDPVSGEVPGDAQIFRQPASWTQLLFGIQPADESRPSPFANPAVRRAAAQCIDRAAVAESASAELAQTYIPVDSLYYNPQAALPAYDPQAGGVLLTNAGWVDADGDPATPRTAQGVAGYAQGAPLVLSLYVSPNPTLQAAAGAIQQGLAGCGMQVNLETLPVTEYLAPGPSGPVFGRAFDLALFAWQAKQTPPCELLLSSEIPGAYPQYAKGWSGANAAGYASLEYDRACSNALTALPGDSAVVQDYAQAQSLLAEDLPLLPLYWQEHVAMVVTEVCDLTVDNHQLAWWNIDHAVECSR
jgi:peptide/nickel transport system substrate-binding protein